jgi:hypothetical protein
MEENNMTTAEKFLNECTGDANVDRDNLPLPSIQKFVRGTPDADGTRTYIITFYDGSELEMRGRSESATAGK